MPKDSPAASSQSSISGVIRVSETKAVNSLAASAIRKIAAVWRTVSMPERISSRPSSRPRASPIRTATVRLAAAASVGVKMPR
ncbi:MAG: hypothetical protein KatS3mg118_0010 [Paracoccaceae bacterium]|nr:MAG: hypothetical protein KatS3mg118_0010 [Paracoccaceae bacterium]